MRHACIFVVLDIDGEHPVGLVFGLALMAARDAAEGILNRGFEMVADEREPLCSLLTCGIVTAA